MDGYMVAEISIPAFAQGHLRRLDMRHDLAKVADLVELCFFDTLDPEGKQYLKEMRKAAQNASLLAWASGMIDESPMPPSGYVWEQDGQLVGNLSLIPIHVNGKRAYMIANVATHPDYRGRGIARALTNAAIEHARSRHAPGTWLQVRHDNLPAIHIYATSGFEERLRRTSWFSGPLPELPSIQPDIVVGRRRPDHWKLQREWLMHLYPPEISWHLPFDWNMFRMDIWAQLYRFLNLEYPRHWSVEHQGALQGVLTCKHSRGYADNLWLAVPNQLEESAVLALLAEARRDIRREQPLSLNFPAGVAVDVLRQAGFQPHQTLIWMERKF